MNIRFSLTQGKSQCNALPGGVPADGAAPYVGRDLRYGRHFVLLAVAGAVAAALGRSPASPGPVLAFALYGAMHAGSVVLSLRGQPPLRRTLCFVAVAALLSVSMAWLGLRAAALASAIFAAAPPAPALAGPRAILAGVSCLGALGYGWLLRAFEFIGARAVALAVIACGCALATGAALPLGLRFHWPLGASLAVAWWLAFSGALWWLDPGARPSNFPQPGEGCEG